MLHWQACCLANTEMPKLDLSPPGMEPLNGPAFVAGQAQTTEEGYVYGKAPKPPREPPPIDDLLEAAGVPGPKEGGLPHSLEWYRGAKDRQIARDKEKEELLLRKNGFRKEWATLIWTNLEECSDKVDCMIAAPQPVGALAELLARTAHERPGHVDRIGELKGRLAIALHEKDHLNGELSAIRDRLRIIEGSVRERDLEGDSEEEERLQLKREEEARKARAERILRRNEALLRGEELPETPREGEELNEPTGPGPAPAADTRPGPGLFSVGMPMPPAPGAMRGGLARELPPIRDPPPPPPFG